MIIERFKKNPILVPDKNHSWEAEAVFNGCPVQKGKDIFLLYRAMSRPHYHTTAKTRLMVSDIGIAKSKDGINFYNRKRFIIPEYEWERFGVEDPRVTKIGDTYYIFYTALSTYPPNANGIKVGLAISKNLKTIQEKHLITPFNAKAMALFPEKINKKMWAILTVNTDKPPSKICLASFNKEEELWSEKNWQKWYQNFEEYVLPLQRRPEDHIEVGAPPIKTKNGWLLFYSYIRDYFSPKRVFSIEAVLLDLKNPLKVMVRTKYPILVPEDYYERIGYVPNVIFPSGAMIQNDLIYLYYGATDTTCALAFISLSNFLKKLLSQGKSSFKFLRAKENPILTPQKENDWEAKAVYNPAAIYLQGKVHILYRAQSNDNTSVFGYATSALGARIDFRSPKPVYLPREPFEQKLTPQGNSGCEDPRLTKISATIYMLYTAFDGRNPPRVALTSISEKDFLNQKWNWTKPALISPPGEDDKDACLFPEKIKKKYVIIHRAGDEINLSFHSDLNFDGNNWLEEYRWIAPRKGMWDSKKIGIAAPPIKTKKGWLILYHGISDNNVYRIGAVLADVCDLTKIISRTNEPIFEPKTEYEKVGQIPNVVFSCGAVIIGKKIFMYYGGADSVVGVATGETEKLLKFCQS